VSDSGGLSATDTVVVNIVNAAKPAAPSGLTAAASGYNVNLAWIDNAGNESGFKVYWRQKVGKKWRAWSLRQTIASPNRTSYVDSNVSSGTYRYYVTAYNGYGESAASNVAEVTK
jgi:fibronectin type 3 domain-containing protein